MMEISFDNNTTIHGFRALDFFHDGSFYLLDTPGHAPGHLSALCRTTSPPSTSTQTPTFIFLGGDSAHHAGIFRPSRHLPLPAPTTPSPSAPPSLPPTNNHRLHPSSSASTLPFLLPSTTNDAGAFAATLAKMQELDASEDVLVLIAHDAGLEGVVDVLPSGRANGWKGMGWKGKVRWRFLENLAAGAGHGGLF